MISIDIDIQNRPEVLRVLLNEFINMEWAVDVNTLLTNGHWQEYPNQVARYFTLHMDMKKFEWKCFDQFEPSDAQAIPSVGHAIELLQWVQDNVGNFYDEKVLLAKTFNSFFDNPADDKFAPKIVASVDADKIIIPDKIQFSDTNPCLEIPFDTLMGITNKFEYEGYKTYKTPHNYPIKTNYAQKVMVELVKQKELTIAKTTSLSDLYTMLEPLEGLHEEPYEKLKKLIHQKIKDIKDSTMAAARAAKKDPKSVAKVTHDVIYYNDGSYITKASPEFDKLSKHYEALKERAKNTKMTYVTSQQVNYKPEPSPWNGDIDPFYESTALKKMEKALNAGIDDMWDTWVKQMAAKQKGFVPMKKWQPEYQSVFTNPGDYNCYPNGDK